MENLMNVEVKRLRDLKRREEALVIKSSSTKEKVSKVIANKISETIKNEKVDGKNLKLVFEIIESNMKYFESGEGLKELMKV